ncbi:PBSX family phage terminase large subunit [Dichelobacter nodosus]|uniref:Phage terminase, large subunit n=3 Tax=Dichelobacter nodosus TaxID=870 RepID=A5EV01_DICNV|nr:PBSX family phage terminase large subunit [Dichelobacter nodosus]ABQ13343.1 phage terminase, large subunit [Dichelobacter nodosus VCS1703A]
MGRILKIKTPRWALPLLKPARYKGAYGGRGGGKSHFFAERIVEEHIINPNRKTVCIREIQKSLRHSVKALVESKIEALGVSSAFDIQRDLILNRGGNGLMIFQGMQDHTADSIKSLEDFDCAWIEEAQSISKRSLSLLRPTIRKQNSEIWASWNPQLKTDPIDQFLRVDCPENSITVAVNLRDNPFASEEIWREYRDDRERAKRKAAAGDKNAWGEFEHIWHGAYRSHSAAQVLAGCYRVADFAIEPHWSIYHGVDWGFASDPTVLVRCYLDEAARVLYIAEEAYGEHVETVDVPQLLSTITNSAQYVIRADDARPELISHCRNHGFPLMRAAGKWQGSIEDGVSFLRGLDDIVIAPRCAHTLEEAQLWSYKTDRLTGDPLPELDDAHDHCWDAIRYALSDVIRGGYQGNSIIAGAARAFRRGR